MRSEEEIKTQIVNTETKQYPKGEYYEGAKEGYILALKWCLE
jgi:hypothetical protein